jgi:hypothetical protein
MKWPASYYCGGADRNPDGAGRLFGTSMDAEALFRKDPQHLTGFLRQFCTQTLPWYYLNRLQRLEYREDEDGRREVRFSDGVVVSRLSSDNFTIARNGKLLQRNGDVFIPALWIKEPAVVAYSADGYAAQTWDLPDEWKATHADIYKITTDGLQLLQQKVPVTKRRITLSQTPDEAAVVVAHRGNGLFKY